eukprot:CAMPEP_0173127808 /NCGR_PEP_ID=MMETSP1102-20130122/58077_1 /TAXON_ID=49646 /ORGANISM="Geminigera sp., Strain Caron Lab Isolate" /LENGTH=80 /DNA_ID=CAMNT_0014037627 /DNA_START=682 /DNA_END=921 /DNA_ORIENTATION=-
MAQASGAVRLAVLPPRGEFPREASVAETACYTVALAATLMVATASGSGPTTRQAFASQMRCRGCDAQMISSLCPAAGTGA